MAEPARERLRRELAETLSPAPDGPDGRLPPLLLLLTVVTGVVDATSYLRLGHVFVANMTGNVVFLGFGLAGAPGISVFSSLLALAAFLLGGLAGGRLASAAGAARTWLLRSAGLVELALVALAFLLAVLASAQPDRAVRDGLIVLLAGALGVQNAAVRALGVADLTTTVLTLTLTGLAADSKLAGGPGARLVRRGLAVAAMLLGALAGGLLALKADDAASLGLATGLLGLAALAGWRLRLPPKGGAAGTPTRSPAGG